MNLSSLSPKNLYKPPDHFKLLPNILINAKIFTNVIGVASCKKLTTNKWVSVTYQLGWNRGNLLFRPFKLSFSLKEHDRH